MEFIDIDHWDRRAHFDYFRQMDYPQFNVCAPVDVTRFLAMTKERGVSFYLAMTYAATVTANGIAGFRYRIRPESVVLHEHVHPSFTYLDKQSGLFKYVTVEAGEDAAAFIQLAGEKAEAQTTLFGDPGDEERDDLLYVTCLPWVAFTSLTHPITLNKNDSVPRLSWGKYYKDHDKTLLPLSVQVHHALADGYHVGQYFTKLQETLDQMTIA